MVFENKIQHFTLKKILIVDDSSESLGLMKIVLDDAPYLIDFASSGFDAINLFEREFYDLILLDINMPDLNGLETFHIIKYIECTHHQQETRVVAFTGALSFDELKRYRMAGFCGEILKPFQVDSFLLQIKFYLELPLDFLHSLNERSKAPHSYVIVDEQYAAVNFGFDVLSYFNINTFDSLGKRLGNIFQCENLVNSECRCMETMKCSECSVYNSLVSATDQESHKTSCIIRTGPISSNEFTLSVSLQKVQEGTYRYCEMTQLRSHTN